MAQIRCFAAQQQHYPQSPRMRVPDTAALAGLATLINQFMSNHRFPTRAVLLERWCWSLHACRCAAMIWPRKVPCTVFLMEGLQLP
eukprot:1161973-Pelagomonas_calceolata.AAC.10